MFFHVLSIASQGTIQTKHHNTTISSAWVASCNIEWLQAFHPIFKLSTPSKVWRRPLYLSGATRSTKIWILILPNQVCTKVASVHEETGRKPQNGHVDDHLKLARNGPNNRMMDYSDLSHTFFGPYHRKSTTKNKWTPFGYNEVNFQLKNKTIN